MKKVFISVFFVLCPVLILSAQSGIFGSFVVGKEGLPAEELIKKEYRGLYIVKTSGGVRTYSLSLDSNTTAEIKISSRIESVAVTYNRVSLKDYADILNQVYAVFGEPYYSEFSDGCFRFLWYDQRTEVTCVTEVSITSGRDFAVEVLSRERK